jgi:hypothetical protein
VGVPLEEHVARTNFMVGPASFTCGVYGAQSSQQQPQYPGPSLYAMSISGNPGGSGRPPASVYNVNDLAGSGFIGNDGDDEDDDDGDEDDHEADDDNAIFAASQIYQ